MKRASRLFILCLACGVALAAAIAVGATKREVHATTFVPRATKPSGPYPKNKAVVHCTRGRAVGPAGFQATFNPAHPKRAQVVPSGLFRRGGSGWKVVGVNGGPRKGRITSIAYCSNAPKPRITASDSHQVKTGGSATATAECPPGTRVLLGGARVKFSRRGAPRTVISRESLVSNRAWRIRGFTFGKRGHNRQKGRLTSFAYCAASKPLRPVVADTSVPPSGHAVVRVTCPAGRIVRFGGYRAALRPPGFDPALVVASLTSPSPRVWRVKAYNLGPEKAGRLRAFAYCQKR